MTRQAHFTSYFHEGIQSPHAIVKSFRPYIKKHGIDTIVVTGGSGMVVGGAVSALVKDLNLFVIRKPGEKSHNGDSPVGIMGERWAFFDDFVDTGASFNRVLNGVVESYTTGYRSWLFTDSGGRKIWHPMFVGVFEYGKYGQNMVKGRWSSVDAITDEAKNKDSYRYKEVDLAMLKKAVRK